MFTLSSTDGSKTIVSSKWVDAFIIIMNLLFGFFLLQTVSGYNIFRSCTTSKNVIDCRQTFIPHIDSNLKFPKVQRMLLNRVISFGLTCEQLPDVDVLIIVSTRLRCEDFNVCSRTNVNINGKLCEKVLTWITCNIVS